MLAIFDVGGGPDAVGVRGKFSFYSKKIPASVRFNDLKLLYIISCIVFTVIGQLLIKKGAIDLKSAASFWAYGCNINIIAGFFAAFVAAVSWIKALQHYPLSYAYPFMSLSFPLVAILSLVVFNEHVRANQWVGLSIILFGLYLGSR